MRIYYYGDYVHLWLMDWLCRSTLSSHVPRMMTILWWLLYLLYHVMCDGVWRRHPLAAIADTDAGCA